MTTTKPDAVLSREPAVRRRPARFRRRLLAAMAGLVVAGVALTSVASFLAEHHRVGVATNASLGRAVEEFRQQSGDIVVPGEAPPTFDSLVALVGTAVNRSVNATEECTFGLVTGELPVHNGSPGICAQILSDEALMSQAAATSPTGLVTIQRLGPWAFVVVPVAMVGDPRQGFYIDVIDEGQRMGLVRDSYLRVAVPAAVLVAAVVLVVGWLLSGQVLLPLNTLVRATAAIGDDVTARVPADSGTAEVDDVAQGLNAMLGRLQASFSAQRQLVDDVGHELRTPLQVIRGHLELADVGDPEDVAAAHAVALDELDRMSLLVDSLVTLAQADAPGFVKLSPQRLGQVVENVVDKARALGPREWCLEIMDDAQVMADTARLSQALLELANNAVKYSPEGSRITWSVGADDSQAWVRVRDQGAGVPPERRDAIFERFVRANNNASGAGLGLAIVAMIVAAHHGRVELESSDVGHGSVFTVFLPLLRDENEAVSHRRDGSSVGMSETDTHDERSEGRTVEDAVSDESEEQA